MSVQRNFRSCGRLFSVALKPLASALIPYTVTVCLRLTKASIDVTGWSATNITRHFVARLPLIGGMLVPASYPYNTCRICRDGLMRLPTHLPPVLNGVATSTKDRTSTDDR